MSKNTRRSEESVKPNRLQGTEEIAPNGGNFTFDNINKDIDQLNAQEFLREKQIKDMELDKDEMYYYLLKPYKCHRINDFDEFQQKNNYTYVCRYDGCDKRFTKAWNALDHVRMHESIRPYRCMQCGKAFTQKCNYKKHEKRHQAVTLEDRKKYKCRH